MSARSFVLNKRRQGNITIERDGLSITCILHKTPVCRFIGGQVQLQSGGWKTVTTKTAINRFLELLRFEHRIFQRKGKWGIVTQYSEYEYHDGMILIRQG